MKINNFLSRLKIPFWCIFAVILALELAASLLRAIGLNLNTFRLVMGVCYIIVAVACCVFYAVTGLRLTKLMRKASKELMASGRVKRLTRVSYYHILFDFIRKSSPLQIRMEINFLFQFLQILLLLLTTVFS